MRRVGIVGGGPAGMMAAIAAGEAGAEVLLLEGNEKLGKKLYITGKGRCNVTNAAPPEEFLRGYARNGRFLHSAFANLTNEDLMHRIEGAGVPLKVERGGRVFPVSDKASDITRALERMMQEGGARVRLRARVRAARKEGEAFLVTGDFGTERFDALVLACGGASYPSTGSDGGGYALARSFGHEVTEIRPALIPIVTKESWCPQLQGLTLKNVTLSARRGKKVLFSELGEMLFTHFGISGPLALSLSSAISGQDLAQIEIRLDLKPGLDREALLRRLERDTAERPRGHARALLEGLLPRSFVPVMAELAGLPLDAPVSQIARRQKEALVECLKALPLHAASFRPLEEAIVTRGGVQVKEVDPRTMESKIVPGLYLAGEMLDVDGVTGGYNLQAAFSTGWCAGRSAAGRQEP